MHWTTDRAQPTSRKPIKADAVITSFKKKLKRPLNFIEQRIVKRKSATADFEMKGPVADSPRVEIVTAGTMLEERFSVSPSVKIYLRAQDKLETMTETSLL